MAIYILYGFVVTFQLALEFLFNILIVSTTTQSVVTQFKLIVNTVLRVSWTPLKTAVEQVDIVQCAC